MSLETYISEIITMPICYYTIIIITQAFHTNTNRAQNVLYPLQILLQKYIT